MSEMLVEKVSDTEVLVLLARERVDEAIRVIDKGLSDLIHRELVSTDEVSDLLLDARSILAGVQLGLQTPESLT